MKALERRLGLSSVVAISISAMLGSGIFVLPSLAITQTGPSVWLAYLLASICILPASMSKSELATAMPTSGGTYVYLERTFGPLAGTVAGLGLWLSLLLKAAFALVGFGAYLTVLADLPLQPTALTFLVIITILNIFGVGKVSSILMVIVAIAISSLFVLGGAGLTQLDSSYMTPFLDHGFTGLMSATALVFVSFAGVTKVAAIAEEIKNPEKNLPRGILISLFLVTVIYCFVTFSMVGNVSKLDFVGNYKPLYTFAQNVGGESFAIFISVVGILTMISMANAGILASSRFPFAMGRDKLLPSAIGKLHKKFLTPVWSILLSSLVVALTILYMDVTKIAKLASGFMILIYVFENIAVIVLRETRVQWYKPEFKSPMYPVLQVLGIISGLGLLFGMGFIIVSAVLGISIPGVLLFIFYSKNRTTRRGVLGIRGKRTDIVVEEVESMTSYNFDSLQFSKDARAVVAIFGNEKSPETLIEMAAVMAEGENLEVAHFTEVPEQTDLKDLIEEPGQLRSLRRRIIAMSVEQNLPITFDPIVSHDLARSVFEISQRLHCKWLFKEWGGKKRGTFTIHNPVGWLRNHLQSNLAIFRDAGVRYIRKVLVVIDENCDFELVLGSADLYAVANKAELSLVKIVGLNVTNDEIAKEHEDLEKLCANTRSRSKYQTLQTDDKVESIIQYSAEYDLLVFGASEHSWWKDILGTDDDKLIAAASCSVISVQNAQRNSVTK
ncbi:amino acid permease [Halobacteriovorax sp. HLS]|uniref:amino acid permease n=1 Tax=Halobacteriovorax sp. HLS TaxID=2234000 RepID=UPI0013E37197|nr:amino acid permease [Halobacteriovorax sp. HLS]